MSGSPSTGTPTGSTCRSRTTAPRVWSPYWSPRFYDAYQAAPAAAPLDLAQNLVHGAVEYARTLGFDPAPDLDATKDHLGPWSGQGAITFGRDGKPFFLQGPHDNSAHIVSTLRRSVGPDNFEYLIAV